MLGGLEVIGKLMFQLEEVSNELEGVFFEGMFLNSKFQ
jgi:hypothetical protein